MTIIEEILCGVETIQYIGHHLWASLLEEIKDSHTLTNAKQRIKSKKENACIGRFCKAFNDGIGFL